MMEKQTPPRTQNHGAAYFASQHPNTSAVQVDRLSNDDNITNAFMDQKQNPPPASDHPYFAPQQINSSSIDDGTADEDASIFPNYEGIEAVTAIERTEDEVPPAYHLLTIGNGDVSAEVMSRFPHNKLGIMILY